MRDRQRAAETLERLEERGFDAAEVFLKAGRSRRFAIGSGGRSSGTSEETGWAVRATTSRASLFTAGSGVPGPDTDWPEPDGQPLQLPPHEPIPEWNPPADLGQALISETEAMALLAGVDKALVDELSGARLVRAVLEEGTSESWIANSLEVDSGYRSRATSMVVEASGPWRGESSATLAFAARSPGDLPPAWVARRLANRLVLSHAGTAPARDRGPVLLASPVGARILYSLMPLWLGRTGFEIAGRLQDPSGRVGSPKLDVVDDGRYPGGVLESPIDGEGRPVGPIPLIEEGRYIQSLQDWRELGARPTGGYGCIRRSGWRDLPEAGPSHLFCRPDSNLSVADLLGSISRGYYLVEPLGAGFFDFAVDRFSLPVCGFVLQQGRVAAPMSKVWLEGGIGAFLRGIQSVARDLTFHPFGAMIGAPSMLVTGLGLRGDG